VAVVDEAALHQQIGGPAVMREQITALMRANTPPNVRIQILPLGSGGHAGTGNSFSILRLRHRDMHDVVYLEQIDSALYFGRKAELEPYAAAMERICVAAQPVNRTNAILEQMLQRERRD
jgi:Domain of unknown function (DUF5753)